MLFFRGLSHPGCQKVPRTLAHTYHNTVVDFHDDFMIMEHVPWCVMQRGVASTWAQRRMTLAYVDATPLSSVLRILPQY